MRDQTSRKLVDKAHENNCNSMKLTKMLDLLARPTRFELVTLGLEMQGIEHTNDLVLHRFVILQYLFYYVLTKMA